MGTMALSLSIKQVLCDVDHSRPYSAKVYAFMVRTEATLPSPSSRGKFSFLEGGGADRQSSYEVLKCCYLHLKPKGSKCKVGFDICIEKLLVVKLKSQRSSRIAYQNLIMDYFVLRG
jgi:hypothetical protein